MGQCEQDLCDHPAGHSRTQQTRASCFLGRRCWHCTDFQHHFGKWTIAALELMTKLKINACRTASATQGRLHGALTKQAKYVEHYIKPGKAPGPNKCPNELLETRSDENFLILQAWVNEMLTLSEKTIDTARQSRSTMNGTMMMMIAFITIKSSLVPLIEGLCAQIYFRFEISVVCSHLLLFFFVKEKTC